MSDLDRKARELCAAWSAVQRDIVGSAVLVSHQPLAQALREVRREALEEAARVCEEGADEEWPETATGRYIAARKVRALANKEPDGG